MYRKEHKRNTKGKCSSSWHWPGIPKDKLPTIPAIMSFTEFILSSTLWIRPTSVLVWRLRTLFRRMAVNMLQISAWQVTSQGSSSSTIQPMLSASWMMKFISRSNSPPTSCRFTGRDRVRGWGRGRWWERKSREKEREVKKVKAFSSDCQSSMIMWLYF